MQNLIIEKTENTPGVDFDASTGNLSISGRAFSNDIKLFYSALNEWMDDYLKQPQKITTLDLQLEYYNSGFYKFLFVLMLKCKNELKGENSFVVKWRYNKNDEESPEDAAEISSMIDLPFELVKVD